MIVDDCFKAWRKLRLSEAVRDKSTQGGKEQNNYRCWLNGSLTREWRMKGELRNKGGGRNWLFYWPLLLRSSSIRGKPKIDKKKKKRMYTWWNLLTASFVTAWPGWAVLLRTSYLSVFSKIFFSLAGQISQRTVFRCLLEGSLPEF